MSRTTPTRKAKPPGCDERRKWYQGRRAGTRTPYTADYDGADANKMAYYWVRWINTKDEKGPWSEAASATIGA